MASIHQSHSVTSVTTHYTELVRYGQLGDFPRALRIANKILKTSPDDDIAYHCKIVCLLQQDLFKDALKQIVERKCSEKLEFEHAYCLYKVSRYQDALKVLHDTDENSNRIEELKAQIYYKTENYKKCIEIYKHIIKHSSDDYEEERLSNLTAVAASMELAGHSRLSDVKDGDSTYEMRFNSSCRKIATGDYSRALDTLIKAESECRISFAEYTMTEEDIEAELCVLNVQKGYCLLKLGREAEASTLFNKVIKARSGDDALTAVACSNIITLNKDQNIFDSKKKMKLLNLNAMENKLSSQQIFDITLNKFLHYLHTGQNEPMKSAWDSLKVLGKDKDIIVQLETALLLKENKYSQAVTMLRKRMATSSVMGMTLAQIQLIHGHVLEAGKSLMSIGNVSYTPGVISNVVGIYLQANKPLEAVAVFDDCIEWYQKNKPEDEFLWKLVQDAATLHLKVGNNKRAVELLEQLYDNDPSNDRLLAQLVSTYSTVDPDKAQQLSLELLQSLDLNIDMDALEQTSGMLATKGYLKKPKEQTNDSVKEIEIVTSKKKKKKKRRSKLANTDTPFDPERWLPKRERSYYKRRKGDKKGNVGKATQGSSVGGGHDFDITHKEKQKAEPTSRGQGARPKQQQKSGKKRRR